MVTEYKILCYFPDNSQTKTSSRKKKRKQKSSKNNKTAKEKNGKKRDSSDDSLSESIDEPRDILASSLNPKPEEIYGQALLNAYAKSVAEVCSIYGGSIYGTRPENIYGNRSVGNILPPENIYGNPSSMCSILPPENIYGNPSMGHFAPPENIYGNPSVGHFAPPENIYGVMQEEIYGPNVNTLSVHSYPGGVTTENLYGTHN